MSEEHIAAGLRDLAALATRSTNLAGQAAQIARRYVQTLKAGGTLFFAGNGGSAADAQHLATEYVVRYQADRRPYAALALTTDTSLLTAVGNDLGFERLFARQIEALGKKGDLLILHTSSGQSPNLLAAAGSARAIGVGVIGFLGKGGGPLKALCDASIVIDGNVTSHIQELHLAIEHLIVEVVEREMGK